ncbi:MAG: alpha/beta fold hydrolase [Solirubrobacteraceae bacterium]
MRLNYHRFGSGPPLLLLHGIGHRWQGWEPVFDRVAPERELIAVDLPGFGDSPAPPTGTPAGIDSITDLLVAFLDDLGLERPHVAGNSLGGWAALELAKRGRAASATALSPAGFQNALEAIYQHTSFRITIRTSRLIADRAEQVLSRPRLRVLAFGQLVRHPLQIPLGDVGPTVRALAHAPWFDDTLRAINAGRFTGGEQIAVPTTIAWGEHDLILLRRQARRAARAIPAARMLTLTGCGHVPMTDDPEQVARVLLEGSAG